MKKQKKINDDILEIDTILTEIGENTNISASILKQKIEKIEECRLLDILSFLEKDEKFIVRYGEQILPENSLYRLTPKGICYLRQGGYKGDIKRRNLSTSMIILSSVGSFCLFLITLMMSINSCINNRSSKKQNNDPKENSTQIEVSDTTKLKNSVIDSTCIVLKHITD